MRRVATPVSTALRCGVCLVLAVACHHAQAFTPVHDNAGLRFKQSGRDTIRGIGERGKSTRTPSVIHPEEHQEKRARLTRLQDKDTGHSQSSGRNAEKRTQRDHDSVAALGDASAVKTRETARAPQREERKTRKDHVRRQCTGRYCRREWDVPRDSQQDLQPSAAEVLQRQGALDVEAFASAISADIARIVSTK